MTTYGPYSFDAEDDSDCQAFLWTSSQGQTVANTLDPAGTTAKFCHDTDGGNSVNVGPDYGQGGNPDGYAYSECSSPGASGDTYMCEFNTTLDASAEQWQFNFYTCQRGPAIGNNQSTCVVQINESGGGWTTVASFGGSGDDTTTTVWVSRSVDLSQSGANTDSSTRVRILITTQAATAWHGDYGIDTIEIVGTLLEGISSIDPTTFDMDNGDVDINGDGFEATQGTGTVYISDANTLAGSANEVEIENGINTWSDTLINLDLTGLTATERANLNTLGPGQRYIIVVNNSSDEYGSTAITLHRAEGFVMSLGAGTPGATTARLTAPATKTTGDFDAGRFEEAANPATAVNITSDNYTEMVWSIEAKTLAREVAYQFRVTKSGDVLDTYTVTPQMTITGVIQRAIAGAFTQAGALLRKASFPRDQIGDLDSAGALERKSTLSREQIGAIDSLGVLLRQVDAFRSVLGDTVGAGALARKFTAQRQIDEEWGEPAADYPNVEGTASSEETTAVSSHDVSLPGSIQAGELLIALVILDADVTVTDWDGFTELECWRYEYGTVTMGLAYKKAVGTEGATITVTTSGTSHSTHISARVSGMKDPAIRPPETNVIRGMQSGTQAYVNVHNQKSVRQYLWMNLVGYTDDSTITAYPDGYTDNQVNKVTTQGVNGVSAAICTKDETAGTTAQDDFTISASESSVTISLVVYPDYPDHVDGEVVERGFTGSRKIERDWEVAGPFPTTNSVTSFEETTAVTTHRVNLPGGLSAGDLILVFFAGDGSAPVTDWEEFTELRAYTYSTLRFHVAYKKATGLEGSYFEVTTGFAVRSTSITYSYGQHMLVDDWIDQYYVSTPVGGISAFPNPNNLYPGPGDGAMNWLWIATAAWADDATVSSFPSGYTIGQTSRISSQGTLGVSVGLAHRESNIAQENPGAFQLSASKGWIAFTVAIKPDTMSALQGELERDFTGGRLIEGPWSGSGALARKYTGFRDATGVLSFSGVVEGVKGLVTRTITAVLTFGASLTRIVTFPRKEEGTLSTAGSLERVSIFVRAITAIQSFSGEVYRIFTAPRTITGVLNTTATLTRTVIGAVVERTIAGVLSMAGALKRVVTAKRKTDGEL